MNLPEAPAKRWPLSPESLKTECPDPKKLSPLEQPLLPTITQWLKTYNTDFCPKKPLLTLTEQQLLSSIKERQRNASGPDKPLKHGENMFKIIKLCQMIEATDLPRRKKRRAKVALFNPVIALQVDDALKVTLETETNLKWNRIDWENFDWEAAKEFWVEIIKVILEIVMVLI
jgi:hypothetical protein